MRERIAAELSALRQAAQLRDLQSPEGIQLGSNDYLGLSADPRLRAAIEGAVHEDSRIASTGSRLLSGNHPRWEALEAEFASFVGAEAALYFSSGYSANVGLLSSILKPEDTAFSDSANHASLIDGIRLSRAKKVVFPHLDLDYLERAVRTVSGDGQKIIVCESLFSMDGDHAPLSDLLKLCERFDALLVIDEAHSMGVDGSAGRGWTHTVGRTDRILATVHTCGKALASMGAFVAGDRILRDYLINHARTFIFSTALPPYCAAHVRAGLELARQADSQREHLRRLSLHVRERLAAAGFEIRRGTSQIVPVIVGANEPAVRLAARLNGAGFAIRPIRPPTVPPGSSRLRLSLHARLALSDIDRLVDTLVKARDMQVVP
jgi:8-amino-7-oxononanoate synthase